MATGPTKKELLLKAAKELFSEHGYSETTFKKISERAGVALGLLTHHFGNKEKLFLTAGSMSCANLSMPSAPTCKVFPTGWKRFGFSPTRTSSSPAIPDRTSWSWFGAPRSAT